MAQAKTEIPSFEEYLKQIKINMWLSGIPYDDPKTHFRFYFSLLAIITMIAAELSFFVAKYSTVNLLELTQLAPCFCMGVLSVLKLLAVLAKKEKVFELTKKLDQLYTITIANQTKTQLIQKKMIILKSLLKYFFILNAALISVYNFITLFFIAFTYIRTKEIVFYLPYAVILPFSTDRWGTWLIAYVHSISCGFICVLYYTTVDALYCVLTCHICNNFEIISNELQYLDEDSVDQIDDLLKSHQYVVQLTNYLEDIFNLPNLFNVLVGSVVICALGFNLTMGARSQLPGCALFLSSVLLQILIMSVFGENIIRESRRVGEAAFLCEWYNMDEKSKKKLLILMTRSHKQQQLTAFKFSVISYASFTKIISTSWSYFTILKTVYKPPEAAQTGYAI
uniref:Odorant receptor n=1 Tax=Heortia vitessoides TaxID=1557813 RepID=A0A978W733_9NEOP|nr:odorant receptor 36 [Heortia vitessoides]